MDLRKLKTILDLFENSKIQELELSEGEERLRLVKGQMVVLPMRLQFQRQCQ